MSSLKASRYGTKDHAHILNLVNELASLGFLDQGDDGVCPKSFSTREENRGFRSRGGLRVVPSVVAQVPEGAQNMDVQSGETLEDLFLWEPISHYLNYVSFFVLPSGTTSNVRKLHLICEGVQSPGLIRRLRKVKVDRISILA